MTTKKAVILIASILAGLILLVGLFVGAITGFVFYTIGNSEAAQTAKTFLKKNEKLKRDIGEVRDFGSFVTGSINTRNTDGDASLSLKVIGEGRTVNATVDLAFTNSQQWRVTGAAYRDASGQIVELLDKYEPEGETEWEEPAPEAEEKRPAGSGLGANSGTAIDEVGDENFAAEALRPGPPVLVYFWAEWCAPCRQMKPAIKSVAQEYEGRARVVGVNVDENPLTTQRYNVRGIPTLLLIEDGAETKRAVGGIGQAAISRLLDNHVTD